MAGGADIERKAAGVVARGYSSQSSEQVSCDTTAGGTLIPTTALANRAWVQVQVNPGEADTLYLGFGTVTATANFAKLTGGQSWAGYLSDDLALKGLSSNGTITVQLLELARL